MASSPAAGLVVAFLHARPDSTPIEIGGGPKPTPRTLSALLLHTLDRLADEDVHRNAAVLGLAFGGIVVRRRIRLGHAGRGQHAIGRPAAMLLQVIDDLGGALFAQRLVVVLAA